MMFFATRKQASAAAAAGSSRAAAAAAALAAREQPSKPIVYPNKEAAKEAFRQLLQVQYHQGLWAGS